MLKTETVIITPVYEDAEAFSVLLHEIKKEIPNAYIIAVDDGSVKFPVDVQAFGETSLSGTVLKLRRNVGHQQALAIGISYSAEKFPDASSFVLMDSDGEDLPSTVPSLLKELSVGEADVIVATRKSRQETFKFKMFYLVYKSIFRMSTGRKIAFGNYMALNHVAVQRLSSMREVWTHVAASVLQSRLRVRTLPLDRGSRYAGKSKMNFVSLALHGFRALMVFSDDVLVRVGIGTATLAIFSVMAGVLAFTLKIAGYATPGWFSTAVGILLIVFLQTGALTLLSLMLTGASKGGALPDRHYSEYILKELLTNVKNNKRKSD